MNDFKAEGTARATSGQDPDRSRSRARLDLSGLHGLISAVIRSGITEEGVPYLRTPGGILWSGLGNLDDERLHRVVSGNAACAVA
jgi:hypothetical protein